MKLDGRLFREALRSGWRALQEGENEVNAINVFPVPDRDTGSNLVRTLHQAIQNLPQTDHLGQVLQALTLPLLEAAQGNAGLILSAYLIRLSKTLKEVPAADAPTLAQAFSEAAQAARRAIGNPQEGTILTVMRVFAEGVRQESTSGGDLPDALLRGLEEAEATLPRTREMLDALREAGVVDAGALGFVLFMRGFLRPILQAAPKVEVQALLEDRLDAEQLKADLTAYGDSIVVLSANGLVKVHIHTPTPRGVLRFLGRRAPLRTHQVQRLEEKEA